MRTSRSVMVQHNLIVLCGIIILSITLTLFLYSPSVMVYIPFQIRSGNTTNRFVRNKMLTPSHSIIDGWVDYVCRSSNTQSAYMIQKLSFKIKQRNSSLSNSKENNFHGEDRRAIPLLFPIPKLIYTSNYSNNEDRSSNNNNSSGNGNVNRNILSNIVLNHILSISIQIDKQFEKSKDYIHTIVSRFQSKGVSYYLPEDRNVTVIKNIIIYIGNCFVTEFLDSYGLQPISEMLNVSKNRENNHHNDYHYYNREEYILLVSSSSSSSSSTSSLKDMELYVRDLPGLIASISSLSQLFASSSIFPIYLPLIIHDWPTNAWRGMLIDVARHYQPIPLLKRCIDAMEASKLNYLHLHLTDSQSFPLLLDDTSNWKLSNLAFHGSFGQLEDGKIYTKNDLMELVEYARFRGIDIIPEIDMPAHSLSWSKANLIPLSLSSMIVRCDEFAQSKQTPHNIYTLDPTIPEVRMIAKEILKQVTDIFPSKYLHIGGDEVEIGCWMSMPHIRTYLQDHNMTAMMLLRDFEKDMIDYVHHLGKTPVTWQGLIDSQTLPTTTSNSTKDQIIIQPWKCWGGLAVRAALSATNYYHYPTVMSACWYLDYDSDWLDFLSTDLISEAISKTRKQNSVDLNVFKTFSDKGNQLNNEDMTYMHETSYFGGEGSMWTENVDHTNLECRMWPRAGAIATRLWGYEPEYPILVSYPRNISQEITVVNSIRGRKLFTNQIFERDYHYSDVKLPIQFIIDRNQRKRNLESKEYRKITITQSKYIIACLIHFRFYLQDYLNMHPAPILFHTLIEDHIHSSVANKFSNHQSSISSTFYNQNTSFNNQRLSNINVLSNKMQPAIQYNLDDAFRTLFNKMNHGMLLSSQSQTISTISMISTIKPNEVLAVTSRCLGIPESIQRPLHMDRIRIGQLNVADGSTGKRGTDMLTWLREKANQGYLLIGFCELNGWQELASKTDYKKNLPDIAFKSASAGFSYYHVMVNSQPFHIGFVSAKPFKILGEYGPPIFQRGVLHVYFKELKLHIIIVHLHAHLSKEREMETKKILSICSDRIRTNEQIVIMGDFNTLSPLDARQHQQSDLESLLQQQNHSTLIRLGKKFLDPMTQHINYEPMNILLQNGFYDSCAVKCMVDQMKKRRQELNIDEMLRVLKRMVTQSNQLIDRSIYMECMLTYCSYTEPTKYNPEWSSLESRLSHPNIRLDYVLVNEAIIRQNFLSNNKSILSDDLDLNMEATVDISNMTDTISDHYPVLVSWKHTISVQDMTIISSSSLSSLSNMTNLWKQVPFPLY